MAYPFNSYPQYFPQTYQQTYPQYNQQTTQIQSGGFISVPNIDVARSYHVAPGTSVTFIDENAPYVYTKTRKSQFDSPVLERYRLVHEEDSPVSENEPAREEPNKTIAYATKDEIDALRASYDGLKAKVEKLTAELGGTGDE